MTNRRPFASPSWMRPTDPAPVRRRAQNIDQDPWCEAAELGDGSVIVALVGVVGLDELRAEHGRVELDRVRAALRDRLSSATRPSAVAVVDDDTFLVAAPTTRGQPEFVNRILTAMCAPVTIDADVFHLCAAIGVAAGPQDEVTQVVDSAGDRLRAAIGIGRGTVCGDEAGLPC
jgi:hypothetical protein